MKALISGRLEAKDICTGNQRRSLALLRCCKIAVGLDCCPYRPCCPCYASSSLRPSIMSCIHQIRRHSAALMMWSTRRLRSGEINSVTPLGARSRSTGIAGQHGGPGSMLGNYQQIIKPFHPPLARIKGITVLRSGPLTTSVNE